MLPSSSCASGRVDSAARPDGRKLEAVAVANAVAVAVVVDNVAVRTAFDRLAKELAISVVIGGRRTVKNRSTSSTLMKGKFSAVVVDHSAVPLVLSCHRRPLTLI